MAADRHTPAPDRRTTAADVWWAVATAAVGTLLTSLLQVRVGLSLGDETWLWYGVQRTLAGAVPLRDFQSYDPGRYALLAAWLRAWHTDRLVPLRLAMAAFQFTALVPALVLLVRVVPARWLVAPAGLGLALWVAPRHKTVDVNAVTWTMFTLAALVGRPDRRRCRTAGAVVALLWLVGRNHVLYGGLATGLAVVALGGRRAPRRLAWVAQGAAVGATPMVVALLSVPGYLRAYWDVVVYRQIEIGATNLTLPVPWPWQCRLPWATWDGTAARATGLGFLLLPAGVAVAAVTLRAVTRRGPLRHHAVLVAATATAVGWANHAFSRADLPHLAQAGAPLFVLLMALPAAVPVGRTAVRVIAWGLLTAVTVGAMPDLDPALSAALHPAAGYAWHRFAGERLYAPADVAATCGTAARVLPPGRPALFLPYEPGLYALFRLRCPTFESYPVYPATPAEQRRAIRAIDAADVQTVLFWPDRIDGRATLGYDQTDPLVWDHLRQQFEPVQTVSAAGGMQVWRRRPGSR